MQCLRCGNEMPDDYDMQICSYCWEEIENIQNDHLSEEF